MSSSLTNSVEEVLQQGCVLLKRLSEEEYARDGVSNASGTIGAHYRHVLEHFVCLLRGLGAARINYDERERDRRIENSLCHARLVTEHLIKQFRNLSAHDCSQECTVISSVAYETGDAAEVGSTIAREIMYCVGHAIHHYAIIKLLCVSRRLHLPYEFGVAPSTLKYGAMAARD